MTSSLVVLLLASFACSTWGAVQSDLYPETKHGIEKAHIAFSAACFHEEFKVFKSGQWGCYNETWDAYQSAILDGNDDVSAISKFAEEVKKYMEKMPGPYSSACNQYLDTPDKAPGKNEASTLSDTKTGYPFQGFAYCMITTFRSRQGQPAVDEVRGEIIDRTVDWREAMARRDNMFRKRHGVPLTTHNSQLSREAQDWVEELASRPCGYHKAPYKMNPHSSGEIRHYPNKTYVGENWFSGGTQDPMEGAYQASNGWYSEISRYTWPNCKQHNDCPTDSGATGHFTQEIWAGSTEVGYGFIYNPKCKNNQIIGRYYPGGNIEGAYEANVPRPKCAEFC